MPHNVVFVKAEYDGDKTEITQNNGKVGYVTTRAKIIANNRQIERPWIHSYKGTHWFVDENSSVYASHETNQPTAPRSMHVRTVGEDNRIVVSIGSHESKELESSYYKEIIYKASIEAKNLTNKNFKIGQRIWSIEEFMEKMETVNMSPRTASVIEAHVLHGIPILSASRHFLRQILTVDPEELERRTQNLARNVKRKIKKMEALGTV